MNLLNKINNINAIEVLDSRGKPTLEVTTTSTSGHKGSVIIPSGASTGTNEAYELRDNNKNRYFGLGTLKAISHVKDIIGPALENINIYHQSEIDRQLIELDGSINKRNLGANAILGASLSIAKCASNTLQIPLYRYIGGMNCLFKPILPMMNLINGGKHADNNLDIQEFMILPVGAKNTIDAIRWCSEIYHTLKQILIKNSLNTAVGDEGGFAPQLNNNEEAIKLLIEAIQTAQYNTNNIKICIDVASTELYNNNLYTIDNKKLSYSEITEYYLNLTKKYPLVSIEDGYAENDIEGWSYGTKKLKNTMLVGDDLFVTNEKLLQSGIDNNLANAILIKPNQIGTLTETLETIYKAQSNGYKYIISHRSGDSEDTTIADLAIATNAQYIKTGAPARSERNAKYNQLLRIYNHAK